jgi:glycosyltransferase involved in cell wall biosynthesis
MAGKLDFFKSWVIQAQLHSIFLVIVHDWRDENTESELIAFLATIDSDRFVFLSSEYGSPGSARNAGMKIMKGQWLTFWDSDDLPDLENVMRAIRQSQIGDEVLVGSFQRIDSACKVLSSESMDLDWRKSVARNPGLWRMIFRKEIVGQVAFTNSLMAEDQLFLIKYRIFDRQIRIFNENFYSYQVMQQDQATRNRRSLLDLIPNLISTNQEIARIQSPHLFYYQSMYIGQALTAIKYLDIKNKINAARQLLIFAINYGIIKTSRITIRIVNEN